MVTNESSGRSSFHYSERSEREKNKYMITRRYKILFLWEITTEGPPNFRTSSTEVLNRDVWTLMPTLLFKESNLLEKLKNPST